MECEMVPVFSFSYMAEVENGLLENEYDHVYFGVCDDLPRPNPLEVAAFKYINMQELQSSLVNEQEIYTAWLKICFEQVMAYYMKWK